MDVATTSSSWATKITNYYDTKRFVHIMNSNNAAATPKAAPSPSSSPSRLPQAPRMTDDDASTSSSGSTSRSSSYLDPSDNDLTLLTGAILWVCMVVTTCSMCRWFVGCFSSLFRSWHGANIIFHIRWFESLFHIIFLVRVLVLALGFCNVFVV